MEDPESEWQIQEYASSNEDESGNMMKWILTKGYGIGRKIVVTGIVVSSAPLVLPPLVVFSAMGVAFSVPVGFLFASFACTNKLMSMLLPIPPPPLMLEYYTDPYEPENYERVGCKLELNDYRQLDDVEKFEDYYGPVSDEEKNEKMEGSNQEVETEIVFELDDGSEDYRQEGQTFMTNVGIDVEEREMEDDMLRKENVAEEEEREQMEVVKQGVEMKLTFDVAGDDEGYEEDDDSLEEKQTDENISNTQAVNEDSKRVDNSMEDDCIVSRSAYNVAVGDVKDVETTKPVTVIEVESEEKEQTGDVNQTEVVFELDDVRDDFRQEEKTLVTNEDKDGDEREIEMEMEDDTLQRENVTKEKEREQLEDVIMQGAEMIPGFDISGDEQAYEEDAEEYEEGDDDSLEEERKGKESLVNENTSHGEEVNEDVVGESASNVVFGDVKDVETTKPAVTVKEIDSQKLVDVGSKNDEPVGELRHVVILSDGNEENNFNSRVVEELDVVAREVIVDAIKDERNMESDEEVVRGSMGTREKTSGEDTIMDEPLIHSNADAREIGGLDLLYERNTNNNLESLEVGNEVMENVADENADVLAFRRSPLDTDNAKAAYKKMPSREGNLNDEKIWEKISAMRTIVGYKAPRQPTSMGELKALYVFTGVEPPASFQGNGDSDLDEVNDKLKFLMAIVGVK